MSIGDPLEIQYQNADGEWEHYMSLHALSVNKDRSAESVAGGGERDWETVKFTVRWSRRLSAIEFDKPLYRVSWRGKAMDIRGYDDYMYQHRRVALRCVSYGEAE